MEHFHSFPLYQALSFMGFSVETNDKGGKDVSNSSTYFPWAMLNGRRFIPTDDILFSSVDIYESIGILSHQDAKYVMMPASVSLNKDPRSGAMQSESGAQSNYGGSLQGKRPGLLLLKMKEGVALENAFAPPPLASKVVITPLGYKKPEAFYQPKYEVPEELKAKKPDLRTTVYWNPDLRTDERGKATFSFYTADRKTTYDIILEGVSDDGQICRYTTTIDRKAE